MRSESPVRSQRVKRHSGLAEGILPQQWSIVPLRGDRLNDSAKSHDIRMEYGNVTLYRRDEV
jgi:hypothetical protein